MKCKNCESPLLKNAQFCSKCGAKNDDFLSSEDRLDKHEREIEDLKDKLKAGKEKAPATLDEQL